MTETPTTFRAQFAIGDERRARLVVDRLNESFGDGETAVAAFERSDGAWDIALNFAAPPDEAAVRELVALAADGSAPDISFDTVEARDWVRASLDGLAPVRAGRFVVHGSHDRANVPQNKLGIEIEAALAFGTGHHGTTRGCLLLLDEVLKRRELRCVLDLGTGTGVLGIAAAKATHRPVLASDIDPVSVRVACDNAWLNGVGHLFEGVCAAGFADARFRAKAPFDLVLANILANPLRALATPMAQCLAPGAQVILSGLLPQHVRGVVAAYRARGLVLEKAILVEGWSSLLLELA
uniref:Ribosomal protein L11 methyltransferase n=1 Tax=Rhodopseudomonas palustris (strain BisA53) TaxID=316055 RepID=Q07PR5_RHOP5